MLAEQHAWCYLRALLVILIRIGNALLLYGQADCKPCKYVRRKTGTGLEHAKCAGAAGADPYFIEFQSYPPSGKNTHRAALFCLNLHHTAILMNVRCAVTIQNNTGSLSQNP